MRIAFAGTPDFARTTLEALLAAGYNIPLVLTQPDRPSGRGLKLRPSAVKQAALDANLTVIQPRGLRLDGRWADDAREAQKALQAADLSVLVVVAYGLLLPSWVLQTPKHGCLNIHASLLPRWRGAAPIQRAIEAGDAQTGISIMQMDEGLDTGPVILQNAIPITSEHTAASLHDELAHLGAQSICEALNQLKEGALTLTPQTEADANYAEKLQKAEAALNFSEPAAVLARRVRAFNPFPGATMRLPGFEAPLKVWQAQALPINNSQKLAKQAGTVVAVTEDGLDIATADGLLRVLEIQRAGARRQPIDVFLRGAEGLIPAGTVAT